MTQSTPERAPCAVCGKECSVNADGTVRHHLTDNADFQAGPDSRKCKGAGQPPVTPAGVALAEDMAAGTPQCRLCKHPVQLSSNGRARSHLTPEATPRPCPAGSDFPLGTYPDVVGTTDGLVATLAVDCGHVPAGQCYACYGEAGNPVSDAELDAMAEAQGTGAAPWGVAPVDVAQPTMADQLKATPFIEALAREVRGAGTVLDVMDDDMRAEAERFMAAGIPEQPTGPDPALPNCPTPETHRAGCGCSDDDSARREPIDGWRTPLDLMEKMPEDVRGLDALRLNCGECGHPVTPLVDRFDLYGAPAAVTWFCENHLHRPDPCRDHECKPDVHVLLGHLETGDHFVRRDTLMRVTGETNGVVHAVVIGGPHDGRTGDLTNLGETVERAPAPRTTEQETTECTDDRTPQQRPASSAVSTPTTTSPTTAPAPGSRQPTRASARGVSPESGSVTSSAPTARAAGRGGSAAVTTDQSAAAAAFLGGGRPAAPAQTGARDQAAAAAQFLAGGSGAHGEKETKRDRFGRYLIPHPDTGKEQAWTRSTTFAKSISDTYALSQWGLRMALLGATMRPDIVQRAHGKHVSADKALLDELTAELKNAAGDKVAANLGTSMHSFTEMADRAWHTPDGPRSILDQVPPDCRDDVETYIRLLEETGLEPVPHLIEFTTVVKQYGVAGTSDNCYKVTKPLTLKIGRAEVRLSPGEYVIGDKKTGKDLSYGWQEIAIQLGTYAQGINTAGVWDRHEEKWHPDPLEGAKVRLDAGIVVHLPVDKGGKKQPAVYGIDLESGWNAAVLCERVREWRKLRTLASPVMVHEAEVFAPSRPAAQTVKPAPDTGVTTRTTVRPPTLRDKARAVTSKGEASAVWQEATAAGLPETEVDGLVDVMQARLRELAEPGG